MTLEKLLKTNHKTKLKKDSKGNGILLDELLDIIKELKLEKKILRELK